MSKFQNVEFRDVNEFLDFLPEEELVLVEALRKIILDTYPNCTEKLAYNVPFYYGHSRLVFLWPCSVPWGGLRSAGVQLGFCKGNLLPSKDLLDQGDRKQVYSLQFLKLADIDVDFVRMMLLEALEVDNTEFGYKAKRKGRQADTPSS
jgi:hypothetical protein